ARAENLVTLPRLAGGGRPEDDGRMAPVRRMSPEARRSQLLSVALDLFAARGYHATSISHIIDRASVARGTFYQYFRSKKQIFDQLLDHLFQQVHSSVWP